MDEALLRDARYDMIEFAKKYFRHGPTGRGSDKEKYMHCHMEIFTEILLYTVSGKYNI